MYSNVESINTAYFIRKNLLEAWTIIEERWAGVFDADNWNISFLTSIGNDNGEIIAYGKNMQGFDIYEDWSSVCTKLCPVGYDGLTLPEQFLLSDVQYEKPYTRIIDFQTDLDEEEKTEENLVKELRTKGNEYLEKNKVPKISYTIISNVNNKLEIGDTIKVLHPYVNIFTEVLEYEYNLISKKVTSLTFGNYSRDVKTKFDNIKNTITQINQVISKQDLAINNQTNLINSLNKNGYVYIDDNEILILDELPKEEAKNVWRFGLGGIGFSSNGYEGPFELAMTMDGQINANFITTGTLAVSRIEGLANFVSDTEKRISVIEIEQGEIASRIEQTENETTSKINELIETVEGVSNKFIQNGGNNLFYYGIEFWESADTLNLEEYTNTEIKGNSVSRTGYIVNSGSAYQNVEVQNGTYTISFKYKKVGAELANASVKINGEEYSLTETDWEEFVQTIEVTSNNITVEFIADTDGTLYIVDLLGNVGTEKDVWTQNPNETRTDTVKIGKGIEVRNNKANTYTRIDEDGTRIYNINNDAEPVAEFTDKGMETKDLEVNGQAQIAGILIKQVGNQTWISSLL